MNINARQTQKTQMIDWGDPGDTVKSGNSRNFFWWWTEHLVNINAMPTPTDLNDVLGGPGRHREIRELSQIFGWWTERLVNINARQTQTTQMMYRPQSGGLGDTVKSGNTPARG